MLGGLNVYCLATPTMSRAALISGLCSIELREPERVEWRFFGKTALRLGTDCGVTIIADDDNADRSRQVGFRPFPRLGIQVNGQLIWSSLRRNFGSQLADLRRVFTLPLVLSARTRPRAKRRTTAMFLAPWPVR